MRRRWSELMVGFAGIGMCGVLVACGGQTAPAVSSGSVTGPSAATGAPAPSATGPTQAPSPAASPTRGRPSPTVSVNGQIEKSLETALANSVETAITSSLKEAGISLASGPDCTADLEANPDGKSASGTVKCTGKTSTGLAVKATFTGSAGANGTCSGQLVVKVGGATVVNESLASCTIDF
ncbi:MAG: hypothetical protein Q8P61_06910 [Candidatus Nanopelagicales bacterium]|nr:hypothetical protein [Candidatus Nanopelagicales bacterium]